MHVYLTRCAGLRNRWRGLYKRAGYIPLGFFPKRKFRIVSCLYIWKKSGDHTDENPNLDSLYRDDGSLLLLLIGRFLIDYFSASLSRFDAISLMKLICFVLFYFFGDIKTETHQPWYYWRPLSFGSRLEETFWLTFLWLPCQLELC